MILSHLPRAQLSRSNTRFRHRMRCGQRACRKRFTLPRSPSKYKNPITCPHCKSLSVRSVEAERVREMAKRQTCCCAFYPFPHERGTLPMCPFNERRMLGIEPSEDELARWEQTLSARRSAECYGSDFPSEQDRLQAVPF